MTIGLTYDLKQDYLDMGYEAEKCAEFDSIDTINAVDETVQSLGYSTIRIGNLFSLTKFLSEGKTVDLVFNICEGLNGRSRESQVPALLEGYGIPCTFSDSTTLALSLDKNLTKVILDYNNIPTAHFGLVQNKKDTEDFKNWNYPLFIKPSFGGTGMGISSSSLVYDFSSFQKETVRLLKNFCQPVLVETYLDGREFTVGITGTGENSKAIGAMEIKVDKKSDSGIYSYSTKQNYIGSTTYTLPEKNTAQTCCDLALRAWKALGCKDCGRIDLKQDKKGNTYVLELNPLAGLHPIDSDLPILCKKFGITYTSLIKKIIDSALS